MPKQQVALRQFVIVASTLVDQCRRSCRVGVASPLCCFFDSARYIFSGVSCCCKRAIVCVLRCILLGFKGHRWQNNLSCVCCVVPWFVAQSRCCCFSSKKGVAIMVWIVAAWYPPFLMVMICSLAFSRLNNGCICWNVLLWQSWSNDDEKWKSRLRWHVKKCFRIGTSGRVALTVVYFFFTSC